MKYKIYLKEGWMGDTLWACNVVKNLSNMGYDIVMFHNWKFMKKLIDLFEIIQNPIDIDLKDYEQIIYSQRINHYENPLVDYINAFGLKEVDISLGSKFCSIKDKIIETYGSFNTSEEYITYDADWQNRTHLNVEYIINELKNYITTIPIGGNRFIDNPDPLIESARILSNNKLHLGMNGGTTHLAAFSGNKIICSSDHMYTHFNKGESIDIFLDTYKCFPNHWADKKHIVAHPNISEDNFIQLILNNLK
jgi:hypothetical protein